MKTLVLLAIAIPVLLLFVVYFVIAQTIKEIDLYFDNDDDDSLIQ